MRAKKKTVIGARFNWICCEQMCSILCFSLPVFEPLRLVNRLAACRPILVGAACVALRVPLIPRSRDDCF